MWRSAVYALVATGVAITSVAHADEVTDFAGDGAEACPAGYQPLQYARPETIDTLCVAFFNEAQQAVSYRLSGSASLNKVGAECWVNFDDPKPQSHTICESLAGLAEREN